MAVALSHPSKYDLDKAGRVGWNNKSTVQYRMAALDKLKSLSPQLPCDLEAEWPSLMENYALKMARREKKNTGLYFRNAALAVTRGLGHHFKGPQMSLKPGIPADPKAFELFVVHIKKWKFKKKQDM